MAESELNLVKIVAMRMGRNNTKCDVCLSRKFWRYRYYTFALGSPGSTGRDCQMLLLHGADINATSDKGMTALFDAVMTNQTGVILLLIHAGASADLNMSSVVINEWARMFAPTLSVENFREGSIPRVFEAVDEIEEQEDSELEDEAFSDEDLFEFLKMVSIICKFYLLEARALGRDKIPRKASPLFSGSSSC